MIYIATIHWNTDKWIDIQLKYLKKHIHKEFRVYAYLINIDKQHYSKFYYYITKDIKNHGRKLNILADTIVNSAENEDDIIIFLDGDAFPVNDLMPFLKNKLNQNKLIAIQRDENVGDKMPHPSFCAITVGFWKKINGDWRHGYKYTNKYGIKDTDIGSNLYKMLKDNNIKWFPMHRSNKTNLHPLFFGIYEDIVYHHGAGFRNPCTRSDREAEGIYIQEAKSYQTPNPFFKYLYYIKFKLYFFIIYKKRLANRALINKKLSKNIYNLILDDDLFYKQFI